MKLTSSLFPIVAVGIVAAFGYTAWQRSRVVPINEQANIHINSSPSLTPMPSPSASTVPSSMPAVSFSQVKPISSVVHVVLKTSQGDIAIDLDGTKAPLAVGNFVYLAGQHFYDGVTFHRVIPGFMIQAGDPLSRDPAQRARHGTGGPGYTFKTELPERPFVRGSLGVARTQQLDTNGSQFFITTGEDVSFLNGQYTNFGTVTSGMDVADAIVSAQRDANDNPLQPISILSTVVEEPK